MLTSECMTRPCTGQEEPTRRRLQNAWWTACLLGLFFMMACFGCLYFAWQPRSALRWLLQTAGVAAYVLWLLNGSLEKNHHPQEKVLRPDLGCANWLTIGRGFLICALAGFVFQAPPVSAARSGWLAWAPGAIYIIAAAMDFIDGYLARITQSETRLGEWLDTKIDALGLLVASVLAIGYDRLPIYYISVGAAYYIFQFVIWYRKRDNPSVILPGPHPAKRMIAGFQMGLVAIALLPVFSAPVMTVAATVFMIPLLAGFFADGLAVCGYVDATHFRQTRWDRRVDFGLTKLFPVFLRLIIGTIVVFLFWDAGAALVGDRQSAKVALLSVSLPVDLPALPAAAAVGSMIALGFMARSAALLLSIWTAGTLTIWGSALSLIFLLACALTLMLTGSGIMSLWQPEDRLLLQRQGEAHR